MSPATPSAREPTNLRSGMPAFLSSVALRPPSDALLAALLVDAELPVSPLLSGYNGVAARVPEIWNCDRCSSAARYETFWEADDHNRRTAGTSCTTCLRSHGISWLGPGRSVYLFLDTEVPDGVRDDFDLASSRDGEGPRAWPAPAAVWQQVLWARGFAGPDPAGRFAADFLGQRVWAGPYAEQTLRIVGERQGLHGPLLDWDDPDVVIPVHEDEVAVLHHLRGTVLAAAPRRDHAELLTLLALPQVQAEQRALTTLQNGTFYAYDPDERWLSLRVFARVHPGKSAEYECAMQAATGTTTPGVLDRLISHEQPEVRAAAIENPACAPARKQSAAEHDTSPLVRAALLAADPEPEVVAALARAMLLRPGAINYQVAEVMLHRHCPQELVDVLVTHCLQQGKVPKPALAALAHGAEPERRDHVQTRLLINTRKSAVGRDVVQAVATVDDAISPERVAWLTGHPARRIRQLAETYLTDGGCAVADTGEMSTSRGRLPAP